MRRCLAIGVLGLAGWAWGVGSPCVAPGATGDVDGNAVVDAGDLAGWVAELADGDGDDILAAAGGSFASTEGVDLDLDGVVAEADGVVMVHSLFAGAAGERLRPVDDWLYQLQNLDLVAVGASAYDLVVMDYSADGSDGGAWSSAQISALKTSAGGPKTVLAYLSIGEAEDYRFYWQAGWGPGNPTWIDSENPDWPGNYKVEYWDPAWQAIVFDYVDRLLAAGFDGAYLDIIDAWEYFDGQGVADADQRMVDFVAALRSYAVAVDPGFVLVPQNAPELVLRIPGYLPLVNGIAQEDIHYGWDADDVATPPVETAWLQSHLDLFRVGGKLVLTVDYATTPSKVDDAYEQSEARCYVPFATVRDLDQLTVNAGHEPD